ncbi:MAG: methyltransferase domain-containing protein [Gemmatimonadetes bacterium]|nr:methyltransferase domain-containing protein [Gemmatimonadota bacterium]
MRKSSLRAILAAMKRERAEQYFDAQAPVYDFSRRLFLIGRKRAVSALGIRPGDRVADWGCGTGLNFPLIEKRRPGEIIGIDASEGMLRSARARLPGARLVKADMTTFLLAPPVDRALCSYALSLVDDWEETIRNMKRGLAPGGRLVLHDFHPLAGAMQVFDGFFRWWIGIHGAVPTRPLHEFLSGEFERVEQVVPGMGFYAVHVADGPK